MIIPPTPSRRPGAGAVYYFHADGEGSIRLLTDTTGAVANRYDYDSFGRRVNVVESVPQPYGWKGREWVPQVGLLYNRARWYDPVLGRFAAEDPLGYGGGDTNFYSFAWNNPGRECSTPILLSSSWGKKDSEWLKRRRKFSPALPC